MKFSIKDFFSKYGQIRIFLWIWSNFPKKSLKENFIFCAVLLLHPKTKYPPTHAWFLIVSTNF